MYAQLCVQSQAPVRLGLVDRGLSPRRTPASDVRLCRKKAEQPPATFAAYPHSGVYPIVTPPDWDVEQAPGSGASESAPASSFSMELPLKALASSCTTPTRLHRVFHHLQGSLVQLKREGWVLNSVVDGTAHLSMPVLKGRKTVLPSERWFTRALAFCNLREIRTVPRTSKVGVDPVRSA